MLKVNQVIRENRKISFRYQKFTIKDRTQQVDRRGGATYKISPFKLIINDGYYYLLAWDSKRSTKQIISHFAVRQNISLKS